MESKLQPRNKSEPKKTWDQPTLIIFGSVESLTQGPCTNKDFGNNDAFTFQGLPTALNCS